MANTKIVREIRLIERNSPYDNDAPLFLKIEAGYGPEGTSNTTEYSFVISRTKCRSLVREISRVLEMESHD